MHKEKAEKLPCAGKAVTYYGKEPAPCRNVAKYKYEDGQMYCSKHFPGKKVDMYRMRNEQFMAERLG
jgi:hypothetical protein